MAELAQKALSKMAQRRQQIASNSTAADDVAHFHGTDVDAVDSILKNGIKATDKTLGFKTAWASQSEGLAHSYGAGAAARAGHDEYAIVRIKSAKEAGLSNIGGNKAAAYKAGDISPEHIDRVEIYKVGQKDPVRTIVPDHHAAAVKPTGPEAEMHKAAMEKHPPGVATPHPALGQSQAPAGQPKQGGHGSEQTGKRGGRFVMVNGKKVYLKKTAAAAPPPIS